MDRATAEEIERHFDVVAGSLRSEIRLVAEGVVGLDEKLSLEFTAVREEIVGVKSLLQDSYATVDGRNRTLERKPS